MGNFNQFLSRIIAQTDSSSVTPEPTDTVDSSDSSTAVVEERAPVTPEDLVSQDAKDGEQLLAIASEKKILAAATECLAAPFGVARQQDLWRSKLKGAIVRGSRAGDWAQWLEGMSETLRLGAARMHAIKAAKAKALRVPELVVPEGTEFDITDLCHEYQTRLEEFASSLSPIEQEVAFPSSPWAMSREAEQSLRDIARQRAQEARSKRAHQLQSHDDVVAFCDDYSISADEAQAASRQWVLAQPCPAKALADLWCSRLTSSRIGVSMSDPGMSRGVDTMSVEEWAYAFSSVVTSLPDYVLTRARQLTGPGRALFVRDGYRGYVVKDRVVQVSEANRADWPSSGEFVSMAQSSAGYWYDKDLNMVLGPESTRVLERLRRHRRGSTNIKAIIPCYSLHPQKGYPRIDLASAGRKGGKEIPIQRLNQTDLGPLAQHLSDLKYAVDNGWKIPADWYWVDCHLGTTAAGAPRLSLGSRGPAVWYFASHGGMSRGRHGWNYSGTEADSAQTNAATLIYHDAWRSNGGGLARERWHYFITASAPLDLANGQRVVVDQSSESGWSAIAGGALSPSEDPTL